MTAQRHETGKPQQVGAVAPMWRWSLACLYLTLAACASSPPGPESSPFTAARWVTADHSWERVLNQAESLMRRNESVTARVLQHTVDDLLNRRAASLRGEGPAMTPHVNRRVTAVIARLEGARRAASSVHPPVEPITAAQLEVTSLQWPMDKAAMSSGFGTRRDPFDPTRQTFHDGIDLVAPMGSRVNAPGPGLVIGAGLESDGCGIGVTIEHSGGFRSRFCHLSRLDVRIGQRVHAGELIGRLGRSGRTTGPHLHWSLRRNGIALDPVPLIHGARHE